MYSFVVPGTPGACKTSLGALWLYAARAGIKNPANNSRSFKLFNDSNMNYLNHLAEFSTVEEGEANIKEGERIRDSMGGDLYWNICNDDVQELKQKVFLFKLKQGK